jgi:hypothetical protein
MTPLHLAVITASRIGDTSHVRTLILRGADRMSEDKQGRTPMKVAENMVKEGGVEEYTKMLVVPKEKCAAMKPLLC